MRLRLFKVAIGGSVGCKRIAPKAFNEMIGTGAQIFRRLASAISRYAGLAEADRRHLAAAGMTSIAKLILVLRDNEDYRLPNAARAALLEMADQIEMLTARIEKLDATIGATVTADAAARRLTSIPGVGPLIAATVRASVQDPSSFKTGRDFSAWIGITPRAHSSGGKERVGKISKQGSKQLRTLLIVGATSILKLARRGAKLPAWVVSLMARRPFKVAAVALANKIARTIWALLVKGGVYPMPAIMMKAQKQERFRRSVSPDQAARCQMRDEPNGRKSRYRSDRLPQCAIERGKVIRRSASRISSWPAVIGRVR